MGEIHYRQSTLKETLNKKQKWNVNDPRAAPYHDVVVQYIIGENKLFNTIEQPFFVNMLHKFKPVYHVPGRTYKYLYVNVHMLALQQTYALAIMLMTLLLDLLVIS